MNLIHTLAYLDPGSGSIIVQALIPGFLAASFGIKIFWRRIVGLFVKPREEPPETPPPETHQP